MKRQRILLVLSFLIFGFRLVSAQALTVSRVKENTYAIQLTAFSKKDKLSWNTLPDSWDAAKPLAIKSSVDTLSISSAHPILKLSEKKKHYYSAPRAVDLQGVINFRDLGGYLTQDGRQVKWGKIYRSADISKLTDSDLEVLASLHIKMVCDLRGEKEVEAAPDRIPNGSQRILLSAGSENIGAPGSFMRYLKNPSSADSMIMALYTRTDHLSKKYKPMFDQMLALETDRALLFHCTAGKDRTGVGAALVLYALGVRDELIYQDYEATNQYRKNENERSIKGMMSMGISEQAGRSLMAAKPEYLRAAFDAIKNQYGSMDLFLEKEMGLDAAKRKLLQAKFLY